MSTGRTFATIAIGMALVGAGGWFGGRMAVESVVHDYLLEHPEILPQAMEELQRRETTKLLAEIRPVAETPFPGAVLGNPQGRVTLVEFTDFACGYCRRSVPDVKQLIARNPDLRIVIRELPIIGPQSPAAARMALAAAEQGKYAAFHDAMFAAGQVDGPAILAAARQAGLDLARAQQVAASDAVQAEISRNLDLAGRLGFSGTPSWIVGNRLISGAVGIDRLAEAVQVTRGATK